MRNEGLGRAAALVLVAAALAGSGAADDSPPADAELVAVLGDPAHRNEAADRLVARGAAAVPALVAGLADAKVRVAVLEVIERIGPPAKDAVAPVSNFLKLQSSPARVSAASALGAIGADAAPALPSLAAWVAEPKGANRNVAVHAIARIVLGQSPPPPPKMPKSVADAIFAGCDWLLRHQDADGRLSSRKFTERCAAGGQCGGGGYAQYDAGVTGLAALALLGAREDAADKPRFAAALRAASWIATVQDKDGLVVSRLDFHDIYNHLCGSVAMAAALRTGAYDGIRPHVEKSVAATLAAQSKSRGGWRYEIPAGDDSDTSVTVWAAELLRTAADAGVTVDPKGMRGAMNWIDSMTEPELGRCGYQQRGGPPARTNETLAQFPGDRVETLTACGIHVRLLAGRTRAIDPLIDKGLALLAAKPPRWGGDSSAVDFYYWFHGSTVEAAAGGDDCAAWRKALLAALLPHQRPAASGCARGSWDPADPWGGEGGRVYATSLALLSLEACGAEPPPRAEPTSAQARFIAAIQKAAQSDDAQLKAAAASAFDDLRRRFDVK